MSFATLFTKLSAVEEDVKSAPRIVCENDKRGNSRKRKPQGEQRGLFKKKQRFQARTDTYNAASFKANDHHVPNTDSVHASSGFAKEVTHYQRNKASFPGQLRPEKNNNHNVNKPQQQTKKMEIQNNQYQVKNSWKQTNQSRQTKGEGDTKRGDGKWDAQVKPARFMTEEFKNQNAFMVDGQLLCRHFLWGRCIKGDECQLKHIQGCNDLIKEVCKYYVQGFCSKGESCLYMHKSFPCKFFHRRGKCSQGPNCRFSHEPLNELTNQLLDEALKRDSQCYELALQPQQESPGERETEMTPDVVMQPVRPSFYNSEETDAEQKALLCQTEEQSDDLKEAVPPCPPPHSSLSAESDNQEPVCYSVEAVLGRSLFKPFPSFSTTPQSQESTCLSVEKSSGCSPDSANQSDAPYSVVAVLRSYKSAESSTFGPTLTRPAAKTVSFNPKSDCAEATDSLLSSDTQNGKVLCSGSSRTEDSKDQGKLFKSLPSHKIYHRSTLESRDLKKPGEIQVMCSAQTPDSVNFKQLPEVHQSSEETQSDLRRGTQQQPSTQTTAADCSSKMANSCDLSVEFNKTPKRLFQNLFARPITDGLKPTPNSATTPTSCQSSCPTGQSEHCTSDDKHVRTAEEPRKTSAKSFINLFASPLSAASLSQPDHIKTTPCSPESDKSVTCTSNLSDFNQRASILQTSLPHQIKSDDKQTSHGSSSSKLSTNPKNGNEDSSCETVKQPKKQQVNPACSLVSDALSKFSSPAPCGSRADRFATQAQQQQQSSTLSHRRSAAAAPPTSSVLKTLFLRLSPYQQDGQQQGRVQRTVPAEVKKNQSSVETVKDKQTSKREGRQKKKLEAQDSHTQTQKSIQNTQFPLEATGGSTLCSPVRTEPQLRNFGTHNSPFKAVMPPVQHRTPPRKENG